MTRFAITNSDSENAREARTTIRLPERMGTSLFQGWGPKF